jgi:hypothetical protein
MSMNMTESFTSKPTGASQLAGGRSTDRLETAFGCAAGAASAYPALEKVGALTCFAFGTIVSFAQALATYAEQQVQAGIPATSATTPMGGTAK